VIGVGSQGNIPESAPLFAPAWPASVSTTTARFARSLVWPRARRRGSGGFRASPARAILGLRAPTFLSQESHKILEFRSDPMSMTP
jgi:hypothetical protein